MWALQGGSTPPEPARPGTALAAPLPGLAKPPKSCIPPPSIPFAFHIWAARQRHPLPLLPPPPAAQDCVKPTYPTSVQAPTRNPPTPYGCAPLPARVRPPALSRYSTLAGFLEIGEPLEVAVARETQEESGVRVRLSSVTYHSRLAWDSGPTHISTRPRPFGHVGAGAGRSGWLGQAGKGGGGGARMAATTACCPPCPPANLEA